MKKILIGLEIALCSIIGFILLYSPFWITHLLDWLGFNTSFLKPIVNLWAIFWVNPMTPGWLISIALGTWLRNKIHKIIKRKGDG